MNGKARKKQSNSNDKTTIFLFSKFDRYIFFSIFCALFTRNWICHVTFDRARTIHETSLALLFSAAFPIFDSNPPLKLEFNFSATIKEDRKTSFYFLVILFLLIEFRFLDLYFLWHTLLHNYLLVAASLSLSLFWVFVENSSVFEIRFLKA